MKMPFRIKTCLAAALVAIVSVPVATAASTINFSLNNLQTEIVAGSVTTGNFDVQITDITASTATVSLDSVSGSPIVLTDLVATISVVGNAVAGGDFSFLSGSDSYTAEIAEGSGTASPIIPGLVSISGLTFNGEFSGTSFGGTDVSSFFDAQPINGVFANLTIGATGTSQSGSLLLGAVVPAPATAWAMAPLMIGLFGYRKVRKRHQLA